ncbi:hypothetical protein HMPREF9120_02744 [Neisseria sp. oral taxon 020 str. F0370]|nr:hypothetical protein HMPREF9120_02744 [Neisseria sp. oral taxon 020 str. F0370]
MRLLADLCLKYRLVECSCNFLAQRPSENGAATKSKPALQPRANRMTPFSVFH